MSRPSRNYPAELRERAVRLVAEVRPDHPTEWAAICSVAEKLGIGAAETLRKWVRQAEVDAGTRAGTSTAESAELRRLRAEVRELKRANEILRAASNFLRGRARPAQEDVVTFIAEHKDRIGEAGVRWGVEPICRVLSEHGLPVAASTFYDAARRPAVTVRTEREETLKREIARVHAANFGVYGARKVWLQLNREGMSVARCTVERLMRELGLRGAVRGRTRRTTVPDPAAARPADLVKRRFDRPAPNRLWVTDFTYVATVCGTVYVAFVIDVYARRIIGWSAAGHMRTTLVLDALEMAVAARFRAGATDLHGLVHHSDAGSQYLAIRYTDHLQEAGIAPSVGTVGDALDNALAESTIGLFKTEIIKPGGPWQTLTDVEIATLTWVDWYNTRRLHTACDDLTPAEAEQAHYDHHRDPVRAAHPTN
ncbi:IS3 family transposase [Streptomyces sp. NBC_00233]|uniref:IS3 family transposase n=1 Tax=Streptomyces sp. NBC_00233 TaxID=2975686 RepID=UPI0022548E6E|nr:IS3 family transposase [Streptomyces sp. NBC_00233]MCX5233041.1 IS3 family transposase [Streptomyces sp. NBC_00233]